MDSVNQSVQQFASALVAKAESEIKVAEAATARAIERSRIHANTAIEVARLDAGVRTKREEAIQELEKRRETTVRIVAPIGLIGVFSAIVYAMHKGMLAESATAMIALGSVVAWMRQMLSRRPRAPKELDSGKRPERDSGDEDDDES